MPTLRMHRHNKALRALCIGNSGTGKTGALASVINAHKELGLEQVVIADWDDGLDVLVELVEPEAQDLVKYEVLRDPVKTTMNGLQPVGGGSELDAAWARGSLMMIRGVGDSGPSTDWGPETLFVCDTITGLGDAAMNWARFQMKIEDNWRAVGAAMKLQGEYIQALVGLKCHVIVNSHIRFMGGGGQVAIEDRKTPGVFSFKEVDSNTDGEAFPSALGRILPPQLPRHFNMMLEYELSSTQQRQIRSTPKTRMALKCPIEVPDTLPQETGLVEIFKRWQKSATDTNGASGT